MNNSSREKTYLSILACVRWIYLPFSLRSVSKRGTNPPSSKLTLILLYLYLLISRWVTHIIISARRAPVGCVLKHLRRDVQHLGHLLTWCMTKYWPIWGQHWSIVSFCLSGWCLSLLCFGPWPPLFMPLTYTNLLELVDVRAEASNRNGVIFWKHPSASSVFIALTQFFPSCFLFSFLAELLATVGRWSLPFPDVLGASYLLLFFPSICAPPIYLLFFHFVQFPRSQWIKR